MPLLKNGRLIDDPWVHVADEVAIPASGPVIVSLVRWCEERDALIDRKNLVGVRLKAEQTASEVAADLEHLGVVALAFKTFRDGRAYSNARRLRERYGYKGELRAIGNVLRDQYLFMLRCGFDALEVKEGETEADWQDATDAISTAYQPAATDDKPLVMSLRERRQAAARATPGEG